MGTLAYVSISVFEGFNDYVLILDEDRPKLEKAPDVSVTICSDITERQFEVMLFEDIYCALENLGEVRVRKVNVKVEYPPDLGYIVDPEKQIVCVEPRVKKYVVRALRKLIREVACPKGVLKAYLIEPKCPKPKKSRKIVMLVRW